MSRIDWLHGHGKGVIFDSYARAATASVEYELASYLLVSNGTRRLGQPAWRSAPATGGRATTCGSGAPTRPPLPSGGPASARLRARLRAGEPAGRADRRTVVAWRRRHWPGRRPRARRSTLTGGQGAVIARRAGSPGARADRTRTRVRRCQPALHPPVAARAVAVERRAGAARAACRRAVLVRGRVSRAPARAGRVRIGCSAEARERWIARSRGARVAMNRAAASAGSSAAPAARPLPRASRRTSGHGAGRRLAGLSPAASHSGGS